MAEHVPIIPMLECTDGRGHLGDDVSRNISALDHPDEAAKKQGYKNCKFNQYASDQIPLDRVGRDTRERVRDIDS